MDYVGDIENEVWLLSPEAHQYLEVGKEEEKPAEGTEMGWPERRKGDQERVCSGSKGRKSFAKESCHGYQIPPVGLVRLRPDDWHCIEPVEVVGDLQSSSFSGAGAKSNPIGLGSRENGRRWRRNRGCGRVFWSLTVKGIRGTGQQV